MTNTRRPATLADCIGDPTRANATPHANPQKLSDLMKNVMIAAWRNGGTLARGQARMGITQAVGIVRAGYADSRKSFWRDSRGQIRGGTTSITLNDRGMALAERLAGERER